MAKVVANIKNCQEICSLRDLNDPVGISSIDLIIGRYGEETRNDKRLIDLCSNMPLNLMNGFHPYKDIHKYSWVQSTNTLFDKILHFFGGFERNLSFLVGFLH